MDKPKSPKNAEMKTKILMIALMMVVVSGCEKKETFNVPPIVGNTYSAFFSHTIGDGPKLYSAYKFISDSTALELLIDSSAVIYFQAEVDYVYFYPGIFIRQSDYSKGGSLGTFDNEGCLLIKSFKMTKI